MRNKKGKHSGSRQATSQIGVDSPKESVLPVFITELHFLLEELNEFNDHDFATWVKNLGNMAKVYHHRFKDVDRYDNIEMLAELSRMFILLNDFGPLIAKACDQLNAMSEISAN